uniref:Complex I assembly factor TIMMDC1, mitochondrial n=1 Tax=Gouania willdenowi TaxID=441366 RepID=A0A8C5E6A3_GOUWI
MGLHQGRDTDPQGTPSTGPAWLCFPRVHGSSSSSSSPIRLPANIGKPELPVTGWERIRSLFDRDVTQRAPEELTTLVSCGFLGGVVGFVYGGIPAARHARLRYIQNSQAEMYSSRLDAVRSAHNAAIRGFVRYGWRWSWRVAVIVSMFSTVNTALCVYRDVDALSHYVTAGAVTVGLFRINLGLRGLVAGGLIGAVLGIPFMFFLLMKLKVIMQEKLKTDLDLKYDLEQRPRSHIERKCCSMVPV